MTPQSKETKNKKEECKKGFLRIAPALLINRE
jgi:hypothetical protein